MSYFVIFVVVYVRVCTHTYAHICMQMHVSSDAHVEDGSVLDDATVAGSVCETEHENSLSTLFFEMEPLAEPGAGQLAKLAGQFLLSPHPALGL